jgi:hypothetical protein
MAMGHVIIPLLGDNGTGTRYYPTASLSSFSIIPPLLHTHAFIYHTRCIMLLFQYSSFLLQYLSANALYSYLYETTLIRRTSGPGLVTKKKAALFDVTQIHVHFHTGLFPKKEWFTSGNSFKPAREKELSRLPYDRLLYKPKTYSSMPGCLSAALTCSVRRPLGQSFRKPLCLQQKETESYTFKCIPSLTATDGYHHRDKIIDVQGHSSCLFYVEPHVTCKCTVWEGKRY